VDFRDSPEEAAFRTELRSWLAGELPPDWRDRQPHVGRWDFAAARQWTRKLFDAGYAGLTWPREFGGKGLPPTYQAIYLEEMARVDAPDHVGVIGLGMAGPTIIAHGTPEQKAIHLRGILSGETIFCQGFSEPGSGSDLASLRTRAVRDGDDYVVTGQKIWTTQAQFANWLFALVRTDATVKPQAGISFLLIDMTSPGVTVRPILSASGDHELNEVFLDDVRVPVANRIGAEGEGWGIAKFLLENERGGTGYAPQLLADLDRLVAAASPLGALLADRATRLRLEAEALEMTELRTLLEIEQGQPPAPRSLAVKLIASEIRQGIEALAVDAFGLAGLQLPTERPFHADDAPPLVGPPEAGLAAARYLNARAWSIFGGTSEIQLNLIARAAPAAP